MIKELRRLKNGISFLIDFVDCWLHRSLARASSALQSVCAAIPNP